MLNPLGTKIINTPRTILRPFREEDIIPLYHNYGSKPEVTKYLNWEVYKNIEQASFVVHSFIKGYSNPYYFNWAIIDKKNQMLIGSVSVHHIDLENDCGELGICISPLYWKQGIGYEVLSYIVEFAFKGIGVKRLESKVHVDNTASNALMKKIGMNLEGTLRKALKKNNKYYDINIYSLISS